MASDSEFLTFALTCRETGIAGSRRLGIKDEVLALDLDNAVTIRLLNLDVDRDQMRAKLIATETAIAVAKHVFGATESGGDSEDLGDVTEC